MESTPEQNKATVLEAFETPQMAWATSRSKPGRLMLRRARRKYRRFEGAAPAGAAPSIVAVPPQRFLLCS